MRCSSRAQRIAFCLPPYDTLSAAPCNKAMLHVHRRHAMGGVCKQSMTALQNYRYVAIYSICTMLMLRLYNCTRIYVVKYKQSIYIGGLFFSLMREKSHKRSPKLTQVAIYRQSEHHAVFIGCQHQRSSHYCRRQGKGAMLSLENAPVSFAVCLVCGFSDLQSSQHSREQWTGVTPGLVNKLSILWCFR